MIAVALITVAVILFAIGVIVMSACVAAGRADRAYERMNDVATRAGRPECSD